MPEVKLFQVLLSNTPCDRSKKMYLGDTFRSIKKRIYKYIHEFELDDDRNV